MTLEDAVNIINDKLHELKSYTNCLVWGAGFYSEMLFRYSDLLKYRISGVIDNSKYGDSFFGMEVSLPSKELIDQAEVIIIAVRAYVDEIVLDLTKKYDYHGRILICQNSSDDRAFYEHLSEKQILPPKEYSDLVIKNKQYEGIHKGERIFILGTAPSIGNMDLYKLAEERTMAVSNFYLHPNFDYIDPDYYCLAQITYTEENTKDFYFRWINEIFRRVSCPIFLSASDRDIVESQSLFSEREINYLCYESISQIDYYEEIDITKRIMMGASVPVDCIQLAIYMGFSEIILLGVEHSELAKGSYQYFYEDKDSIVSGSDPSIKGDGGIKNYGEACYGYSVLWKQYSRLKNLAQKKSISIINATPNSILDVFERREFRELFD